MTETQDLFRRIEETKAHTYVLMQDFQRLRDDFKQRGEPLSRSQLLEHSPYARLVARMQTMPVIEQAKGIIMAQSQCGDAEAFDILRRASQRSNVPVRKLAAQIVANTAGRP
jgi:AmiR/NasT family two-component response regulator